MTVWSVRRKKFCLNKNQHVLVLVLYEERGHHIPSHTNLEQKKRKEKKRNVRSNPGAPNGNPFLIMAANKPS
jgi:hypothetical protein